MPDPTSPLPPRADRPIGTRRAPISRRSSARPRVNATRVLKFGDILQRTISAWAPDSWKFALIFIVVNGPILLLGAWVFSTPERWIDHATAWRWGSVLGSAVFGQIAIGATVHGVFQRLDGRPADIGKCLSTGTSRFGDLFGVAFMVGVYTVMLTIAGGLLVMVPLGLVIASLKSELTVVVLMLMVAFTPTLLVKYLFWTAAPVCVVEKRATGDAMRRARELQRGNQGPIVAIVAILLGLQVAAGAALAFTVGRPEPVKEEFVDGVPPYTIGDDGRVVFGEGTGRAHAAARAERERSAFEAARKLALLTEALELLIMSPLLAVAAAVTYHDLRRGKEGIGTAELIRVFE